MYSFLWPLKYKLLLDKDYQNGRGQKRSGGKIPGNNFGYKTMFGQMSS